VRPRTATATTSCSRGCDAELRRLSWTDLCLDPPSRGVRPGRGRVRSRPPGRIQDGDRAGVWRRRSR
jgi:hypothetical protein